MFIINLNYIAPLEKIDGIMKEHVAFLQKYYKKNIFIVSGRKIPRTGGIILAVAKSKEDVDKIMQEDPFVINQFSEYSIIEFNASQSHPDLKRILAG